MGYKRYLILLYSILFFLYLDHFDNSFHFDDSHTIIENNKIKEINIWQFFSDSTTFSNLPSNQSYRPIVTLSIAIDYFLAGELDPFYFHVTNFLFFLFQIYLMYIVFYKLLNKFCTSQFNREISLFAITWYALHGVVAETVNYIIARSDIISSVFILLSFNSYITKRSKAYLIYLTLGLLTKESALVVPLLIVLYEFFIGVEKKEIFKKVLPALILCIFYYFFNKFMAPQWVSGGNSRWMYLATQPYIIMKYFFTFIYPNHLTVDTDIFVFSSLFNLNFFIGITFLFSLLFLIFKFYKIDKVVAFGLCWFLICLSPTSSFIPLSEVMNDHRMYLPLIGLCLSGSRLLFVFNSKFKIFQTKNHIYFNIILILIIFINVRIVIQRNLVWHSEKTLWEDCSIKSPKNGRALMNYGVSLMGEGDYSKAKDYFDRALVLYPNYYTLHINLGVINSVFGNLQLAEQHFEKAINLRPSDLSTYKFYVDFLIKNNNMTKIKNILSQVKDPLVVQEIKNQIANK